MDGLIFALVMSVIFALLLTAVSLRPTWVIDRARTVLALIFVVSVVSAVGLVDLDSSDLGLRLELDPSTEPLLPVGDPSYDLYRRAVLEFGDDEVFVIVVECPEVFSRSCLSAMERVSDRIVHVAGVRSVRSLLDATSFRYVPEEDWVEVRPFIGEIPDDPEALARLRARALADPVYRRTLISEDGRAAALNVSFRKMSDAEFIAAHLDEQIASILEEESKNGRRFHVAGRPHVKTRVFRGMVADLTLLIPLSIAVVAVILWLVTGAVRGVVLPIATALLANLWTFSAIAFLDRSLTLLTGLLGPTLLAIGSVYGVHLLARYEEEVETGGASSAEAVALRCLQHMIVPVLIAGLTTMIGFAALLITDVPAVFELGAFAVLGIASITLLVLTGLPAALALLPVRARMDHRFDRVLDRFLSWLARSIQRRVGSTILLSAGVVAVAAFAIPSIVIDTDYMSYLDEEDPVRLDFEAVNRLLVGAIPIYVVLDGGRPGGFREPDLLHAIERMQQRFEELPAVSRTLSFVETLRVLNRAFLRDDPAEERIPDSRAGVTELLFMIPKSDLQRYLTVDHRHANVIVRTGEVGSAAIRRLSDELESAIAAAGLPPDVEGGVTGNAILLAHSADGIARGQPLSVGLAVVGIFLLIALGLRSPGLGVLAMIPNVIPVLVFFGLLGLGAAPLSLPTSLIGCVALGIAIDDTVHFMVRYRAERIAGATPEEASLRCGLRVGRPIAISSIMLFLGFLVITASQFATLREFGLLSAVTIAICLVTDLILLPALLIRARI